MATTVWHSLDGNWNAVGSWTNGIPGPGADVAVFSGVTQTSAITNLDQAGDNLGLIYIAPEYEGDIGGMSNPLKLGAAKIVHRGQGVLYLQATTNDVDNLIINTNHSRVACVLSGGTNQVARLRVQHGRCVAGGKLDLVEVTTGGICQIVPYADTLGAIHQNGGYCSFRRTVGTAVAISGGFYHHKTGNLATLMQGGGLVQFDSSNATGDAYALTDAYMLGGTLDLLGNVNPKSVTNLYQWPGAVVRRNDDVVTVGTVFDMTGELRL